MICGAHRLYSPVYDTLLTLQSRIQQRLSYNLLYKTISVVYEIVIYDNLVYDYYSLTS